MALCSVCSKDIPEGAMYCPWCGTQDKARQMDAAQVAGMQQEIEELRRKRRVYAALSIVCWSLGGLTGASFAWLLARGVVDIWLLLIGIGVFAMGYGVSIVGERRYSKKIDLAIRRMKQS